MVQEVALVDVHVMVDDPPATMVAGLALILTVGAEGGTTVIRTLAVA
jgi:hypothetical protein